jgi:homoserine dehydrogenase
MLSAVSGVFNAIFVVGDSVGETMFYGEGAGAGAAASAVVGDLIEVAQHIVYGNKRPYITFVTEQLPLMPLSDVVTSYYIRLPLPDVPGVLAKTAECFAAHGVSIFSVSQQGADENGAQLVYITHEAREASVQAALAAISETGVLKGTPVLIRVAS